MSAKEDMPWTNEGQKHHPNGYKSKKALPKLVNPIDEINGALTECATTLSFSLGALGVNKVSGTRTLTVDGKTYEVSIDAKILKH